jgi:NAD(P)-dependent dehydrogenase (short-subunit alcohol dehydrogenase family)
VEEQIPAKRIGIPQDCVGACLLLCSEAGAYITGSTLFVDGGWHAA